MDVRRALAAWKTSRSSNQNGLDPSKSVELSPLGHFSFLTNVMSLYQPSLCFSVAFF